MRYHQSSFKRRANQFTKNSKYSNELNANIFEDPEANRGKYIDGEKKYSEKISNWFSYTDPVRCDLEHVKLKDLTDEDKMIALGDIMKDENNYPIKSIKD